MKLFLLPEKPWIWFVGLLAYLTLIFFVSHIPLAQLQQLPFDFWDKAVHCVEYMPVGFLVTGLVRTKWTGVKVGTLITAAIFISIALAGLDEFHQSFVPGRDSSIGDAIADGIGAAMGSVIAAMLFKVQGERAE